MLLSFVRRLCFFVLFAWFVCLFVSLPLSLFTVVAVTLCEGKALHTLLHRPAAIHYQPAPGHKENRLNHIGLQTFALGNARGWRACLSNPRLAEQGRRQQGLQNAAGQHQGPPSTPETALATLGCKPWPSEMAAAGGFVSQTLLWLAKVPVNTATKMQLVNTRGSSTRRSKCSWSTPGPPAHQKPP